MPSNKQNVYLKLYLIKSLNFLGFLPGDCVCVLLQSAVYVYLDPIISLQRFVL